MTEKYIGGSFFVMKKVEPGAGWNKEQVEDWHNAVIIKGKVRSYQKDVVARLEALPSHTHMVKQYGVVSSGGSETYPVFQVTVGDCIENPNILLMGGVHGYEPSGVEASFRFLEEQAVDYSKKANITAFVCVSPWAYEYNQRWNWQAEDPNRLFTHNTPATKPGVFRTFDIDECRTVMEAIEAADKRYVLALDKHETSDMDIDLRIDRAERFGLKLDPDYKIIPQGYYLTLSEPNELDRWHSMAFGHAIIDEVAKVSPIAPEECVLNKKNHGGIIFSPAADGLSRTFLGAVSDNVGITEVYPDHPDMTPEKAVQAQLASIRGALNFIKL